MITYFLDSTGLTLDGQFIGRINLGATATEKDFEKFFHEQNPGIPVESMYKTFDTLIKFISQNSLEGRPVDISNTFRFTPVIKGSLTDSNKGFTSADHALGVNCTLDNSLIKELNTKVEYTKKEKAYYMPRLMHIYFGMDKINCVHRTLPNTFKGSSLKPAGYDLAWFTIKNEDESNKINIPLEQIHISSYTKTEISFCFLNSLIPPAWLVHDANIFVTLGYKNGGSDSVIEASYFKTTWKQ